MISNLHRHTILICYYGQNQEKNFICIQLAWIVRNIGHTYIRLHFVLHQIENFIPFSMNCLKRLAWQTFWWMDQHRLSRPFSSFLWAWAICKQTINKVHLLFDPYYKSKQEIALYSWNNMWSVWWHRYNNSWDQMNLKVHHDLQCTNSHGSSQSLQLNLSE